MTIAQNILACNSSVTFAELQKLRNECQDLAVSIGCLNCYDRVYCFYDGSEIMITAEGVK